MLAVKLKVQHCKCLPSRSAAALDERLRKQLVADKRASDSAGASNERRRNAPAGLEPDYSAHFFRLNSRPRLAPTHLANVTFASAVAKHGP